MDPSGSDIVDTTSESEASHNKVMRDLHTLLLETEVREGKMVCGNCGHKYRIKEGIANFLLPSHLGELFPFISLMLLYICGLAYKSVLLSKRPSRFICANGLGSFIVV